MRTAGVAFVLAALLVAVSMADDSPGLVKAKARRFRSLAHACRDEIARLCTSEGKVKAGTVKCLDSKQDDVKDEVCKSWLDSRNLCFSEVDKNGDCANVNMKRQCLRKMDVAKLSAGCKESDFYKSVMMFGMLRRRGEKSGGNSKSASGAAIDKR